MDIRERRSRRRKELFQVALNCLQGTCIGYSAAHYYWISNLRTTSWLSSIKEAILVALTVLCFVLWFVARIQLGVHLTFQARADKILVQTGLYAKFKHPIYYFGSLSLLFFVLLIQKYILLLGFFLLIPVQIVRAMRENVVLKKRFEDEYLSYRQKTWL